MTENIAVNLLTRAQRGSSEAVGALYSRYHRSIYRYFYYRTGDPKVAEDLTSDVFLRMVEALRGWRIDGAPIQAWLFHVARNLVIDYYRRNNPHPVVAINENLDGEDQDVDRAVDRRLSTDELVRALSKLDSLQRDVLLLRFIEGMPIAETAQVLHKSIDATKGLQRRALIALRAIIAHREIDDAKLR